MVIIKDPLEFEWDKGNVTKNYDKHGVNERESEEAFFDENRRTFKDRLHSNNEERFRVIGMTKSKRLLFVVFTIRKEKIRVISARDVNRKEVKLYEEKINTTKI